MRIGLVSAFLLCCHAQAPAQVWTNGPDMPVATSYHASESWGTNVYVFGGSSPSEPYMDTVQVFDTNASTWSIHPSSMPGEFLSPASVRVGDTIYLIGGESGFVATDGVWAFDPVNGTWSSAAPIPDFLFAASAVVAGDRVYVIGGTEDRFTTASPNVYVSNDLSTSGGVISSWSLHTILPLPLVGASAGVIDDTVYVAGGRDQYEQDFGIYFPDILRMDSATGGFVHAGFLTVESSDHAGITLGGRFFNFGGYSFGAYQVATSVFTPYTGATESGTGLATPARGMAAATVDGLIYVTGGYEEGATSPSAECRIYDPIQDGFPYEFTVGGEISGVVGDVTLQLNGASDLTLSADGPFTFAEPLLPGTSWEVTVQSAPANLNCVVTNGTGVMGLAPVTDVSVVCTPLAPEITGVADIPNDQGGQARLRWAPALHDSANSETPVTSYALFRRIDTELGPLEGAARAYPSGDWEYLDSVPAFQEESYATVVPTLADSTITDGMHWSTYFVRAATADPGLYFDSLPDSGYSTDDLAPSAPTNLIATEGGLAWDDPVDADFRYFSIYGSATGALDGTEVLLEQVVTTSASLPPEHHDYYLVTATDFSGNEGPAATVPRATAAPPSNSNRTALLDNRPNPFNPGTTIHYELAADGPVELVVYDVSGRRVRTLVRGPVEAGLHEVRWDGRDSQGRSVSSGVYLYRMVAGEFSETKRLTLLK